MTVRANSGNTRRKQQRIRPRGCRGASEKPRRKTAPGLAGEKLPLAQANATTSIAPHLTAFFEQRLPIERGASENTRQSYAYAFQLLLTQASRGGTIPVDRGAHRCAAGARLPERSGNHTRQWTKFPKHPTGRDQIFHTLPGISPPVGDRADPADLGDSRQEIRITSGPASYGRGNAGPAGCAQPNGKASATAPCCTCATQEAYASPN